MTSKNSFFKLLWQDLVQRLWSIILSMVVVILPITTAMALLISNRREDWTMAQSGYSVLLKIFRYDNFWFYLVAIVGAIICAGCSFGYLFSKREVDFFHSLPVTRSRLFAVRYLSGMLVYAVPNLLMILLNLFIFTLNFGGSFSMVKTMFFGFFYHLMGFMIIYSAASVCMLLVGNMVVFFGIALWMFSFLPLAVGLIQGMESTFFDTFLMKSDSYGEMLKRLRFLSPGYFYVGFMTETVTEQVLSMASFVFQLVLMVALYTAAAYLLYRRRPSEGAGKAIVFSWAKPLVRISTELLSGTALGYIFYMMVENKKRDGGWICFGVLIGVILCHMFIESVLNYDVKKCFSECPSMLGSIVVAAALVLVLRYDVMGYDSYLPKKSSLASVKLWVPEGLEGMNVQSDQQWVELENIDQLYPFLTACRDYRFEQEDSTNEMARTGQTQAQNVKLTQIRVGMKKKSGVVVYRRYRISTRMLADYFGPIYDSAEYKEKTLAELKKLQMNQIQEIEFKNGVNEALWLNAMSGNQKQELLRLFMDGYEKSTWKTRCDEAPLFLISLQVAVRREEGWTEYSNYNLPVYESYTEVIRFTEQSGFEVKPSLDISRVESMLLQWNVMENSTVEGPGTLWRDDWISISQKYAGGVGDKEGFVAKEDWEKLYQSCIWDSLAQYGIPELYTERGIRVMLWYQTDQYGNYDIFSFYVKKGTDLSFLTLEAAE